MCLLDFSIVNIKFRKLFYIISIVFIVVHWRLNDDIYFITKNKSTKTAVDLNSEIKLNQISILLQLIIRIIDEIS